MEAIGIIPARYGSTRLDGKVLAPIAGKPMIQHVWEQAKKVKILDDLIIAADDERIIDVVKKFGGKAIFTAKEHRSGTDRLTEIANPLEVKVVVNIQADEPMIDPSMVDGVVRTLLDDEELVMATVAKKITAESELTDPNVVKVIVDKNGFAIYFSRAPIPYVRESEPTSSGHSLMFGVGSLFHSPKYKISDATYKHIGMYAYTKDFLFTFTNMPTSSLEKIEKLEQLRVLENGYKIKILETTHDSIGVDTPEDLERVKKILE